MSIELVWCHPTISSSVMTFSLFLQSFPASESFPVSWLFALGGRSIGTSTTVLPMNIQSWFPLGLTGLISLQCKELSRVFSSTTIGKHYCTAITTIHLQTFHLPKQTLSPLNINPQSTLPSAPGITILLCLWIRLLYLPHLNGACVLNPFSCVQLCDAVFCSPPVSSVHGISQARILEWVAISFSRGSSQPRNWTCVSCVSCICRWSLYGWCHLGSPPHISRIIEYLFVTSLVHST